MRFLFLTLAEKWEQPGILGHPPNISSSYPPLGLLYIGAALENNDHKVEIIDLGIENLSEENLNNYLKSIDAVGISVYTNNYEDADNIAKTIKQLQPELPIIIGGPHCTFLKEKSLIDIPEADIAVELEGDEAILDIVEYLIGQKKLADIHGIFYKENGQIKSGKPYKIIKDMDSLLFPARHLVEKYEYGAFGMGYISKKKFTSMLTSRGCAFRCRFCSRYSNVVKGFGFRQRSAESVVEELKVINEKYNSVAIVDDNFLADAKRSHKIFDMILESDIDLDFLIVGARVDSADSDLYKKMKKAGVNYISYGIESGNQDILDYYNKKITLDQIRNAVNLGRKMGFFLSASLILGAPIETEQHIKNTIKFVLTLPLDTIVARSFYYDMGAELWNEAVKDGKISENEYVVPIDSNRGLGNFTIDEINDYQRKAFKQFYLRPSYIIGQFYRSLKQNDIDRIKNTLKIAFSPQIGNVL